MKRLRIGMRRLRVLTLLTMTFLALSQTRSFGQLPSVVQLPSFQTFSYSGSVLVPDRGTTALGGVRSSAMASRRTPFGRSFAATHSNAQLSISATIIDLEEMDRQILGDSPRDFVRNQQRSSTKRADPTEEGKALVRYARRQYRDGNQSQAFATYRMAIACLDGRLQELAIVEFRRIFGPAASQALAGFRR